MTTRAALIEQLAANLKRHGFSVHYRIVPEIPEATVSHALYALADPGSVVIAASPEEPRARSLLPEIHLTIVAEDRVLPGLPELLERSAPTCRARSRSSRARAAPPTSSRCSPSASTARARSTS